MFKHNGYALLIFLVPCGTIFEVDSVPFLGEHYDPIFSPSLLWFCSRHRLKLFAPISQPLLICLCDALLFRFFFCLVTRFFLGHHSFAGRLASQFERSKMETFNAMACKKPPLKSFMLWMDSYTTQGKKLENHKKIQTNSQTSIRTRYYFCNSNPQVCQGCK